MDSGIGTGFFVCVWLVNELFKCLQPKIRLPSIGFSGPIASWATAIRYIFDAERMLQVGYDQRRSFKVPTVGGWQVTVSDVEKVEEIRKAPEEKLSFMEAVHDFLAVDYIFGPEVHTNPYHIPIVRGPLARNLGPLFDDLMDEIERSFDEYVSAKTDEWLSLPALQMMLRIVSRTSNRLFVGYPLCRDPDWQQLTIQFAVDVMGTATVLNLTPPFLRSIIGKYLSPVPRSIRRGIKHLGPQIEERLKLYDEFGKDYPGKPNDLLAWLMDEATGPERTVRALTLRVLTVNVAAIHTSSMTFTHALFYLASCPETVRRGNNVAGILRPSVQPLRDEISSIVDEEGWTKAAMGKMLKLDSFFKEALRHSGLGAVSVTRKAMEDYTFADGTTVPKGQLVSVAAGPLHRDETHYHNADKFIPFRFVEDMGEGDDPNEGPKNGFVNPSPTHLSFGIGRSTCPGRFFAANELKAMLAWVLMHYEVKHVKDGVRPKDQWFGSTIVPNTAAHIMFRRREG